MNTYSNKLVHYSNTYCATEFNKNQTLHKIAKYLYKQHGGVEVDLKLDQNGLMAVLESHKQFLLLQTTHGENQNIPIKEYDLSRINYQMIRENVGKFVSNIDPNSTTQADLTTHADNSKMMAKKMLEILVDDMLNGKFSLNYNNHNIYVNSVLNHTYQIHKDLKNVQIHDKNEIMMVGDIHGDAETFLTVLYHIGKIDGMLKRSICFTGDYCDRGIYSFHVLLAVCCLSILFTKNVIMLRGNHETVSYWFRMAQYFSKDCILNPNTISNNPSFDLTTFDCVKTLFNGCKYYKDADPCNNWNCQTACASTLQCVVAYLNNEKDRSQYFVELMNLLVKMTQSLQSITIIRINEKQTTKPLTICCAHGSAPLGLLYDHPDKRDLADFINYINSYDRKTDCGGSAKNVVLEHSAHLDSDAQNPLCSARWVRTHDTQSNGSAYCGLDETCVVKNKPMIQRQNSILTESPEDYIMSHNNVTITSKQTTQICVKYGIDLIIRGHEFVNSGFKFTHPRVLTNHTRPVTQLGAITIIDRNEIILLTIKSSYPHTQEMYNMFVDLTIF